MREFGCLVVRSQIQILSGLVAGTPYDLGSACAVCGAGARQTGPLRLKATGGLQKRDLCVTLDFHTLLSRRVAVELQRGGVSSLGEVTDVNGQELPVMQLLPQATLPRFASRTTGVLREDPCRVCDRNGHFGDAEQPYRLVYAGVPSGMWGHDVLATWECFGASALRTPVTDSVLAQPLNVVSRDLFEMLRTVGVRQIEFQPIAIEV